MLFISQTKVTVSLKNAPATRKLMWLVNSVKMLTKSAAWLIMRHREIDVRMLPTRSLSSGIIK